jgi:hypothetical protein
MCNFMKVSRSGYYEWLNAKKSLRDIEDEALMVRVQEIFVEGRWSLWS